MDYQQCELWASRVGIPITEVCPQGLRPLPSLSGYLQLGYVVARSMAIRDALKKGKNDELAEDASSVQETLRDLGANAELWKLTKELGQPEIARRFFRDCEYTLLHRRLVWHLS